MQQKVTELKAHGVQAINAASNSDELQAVRLELLGKKGSVTALLKSMGGYAPEERKELGQLVNSLRTELETLLDSKKADLDSRAQNERLLKETVDMTLPGVKTVQGSRHPLNMVIDEISEIFLGMGFSAEFTPEVELVKYNFDMLNAPKDHPSRDMQDTFYIAEDVILRTQTSPTQVRVMEKGELPIKIIAPGRVYRVDEVDATHSPVFHQMEGLVVDKGVTMSDLKGTLTAFAKTMFGEHTATRFRPHHFPFTEPSAEMDVTCFVCGGEGCRLCKGEGWIEILGAGMVHPEVLKNCGVDPEVYSGFAFGMGLDRITMLKYEIDDLRLLFENDVRFLTQFRGATTLGL